MKVETVVDARRCVVVEGPGAVQRPTADGAASGIVSLDPFEQQCRGCGRIAGPYLGPAPGGAAISVILSGFRFHWHEASPVRRCPECHEGALKVCGRRHD